MLHRILQSKSKTFLTFCFCFLAGVVLASLLELKIDLVYLYLSLFILISFLIAYWSDRSKRFVIFSLLFITLGVGRYLLVFPNAGAGLDPPVHDLRVEVVGFVSAEPDIRTDGVRYILKIINQKSEIINEPRKGSIYLKQNLYPRYNYGDKLQLSCIFERPEEFDGFRYDMYLARYGVFTICQDASVLKIGEGEGNFLFRGIFSLKQVVADKINKLWHEPNASFMAGLLYGYRGGLGELNDLFNRTGVTHIVAISGYNISIIATVLITICVQLLIPRKKAFWLITGGIILFVLFAGAGASVIRAGIMGILVLFAKQVGRLSRVGNAMALVAVLMILQNPLILIWDAGFQLSFVATLGLVYLAPLIQGWFERFPQSFGIRESVVSTFSAIIATLPLILFQFGRLSIVAPIVNVLILWLIPFIMLFGFLAVLFSFIFFPIGELVAWIALFGLQYIITIVKWFAGLKFSAVDLKISWWVMVLLYVGLFYWVYKKNNIKFKLIEHGFNESNEY
ncbi:ComEC family competence protein [Patescibacteria group bacterium]|nr:ComEC family competence protein [Patescibacteria group bacterium]